MRERSCTVEAQAFLVNVSTLIESLNPTLALAHSQQVLESLKSLETADSTSLEWAIGFSALRAKNSNHIFIAKVERRGTAEHPWHLLTFWRENLVRVHAPGRRFLAKDETSQLPCCRWCQRGPRYEKRRGC